VGLLEAINHSIFSLFRPATPLDTTFITQASVAFVSLYLNHIDKLGENSIANGVSSRSFISDLTFNKSIMIRSLSVLTASQVFHDVVIVLTIYALHHDGLVFCPFLCFLQ